MSDVPPRDGGVRGHLRAGNLKMLRELEEADPALSSSGTLNTPDAKGSSASSDLRVSINGSMSTFALLPEKEKGSV